MRRRSRLSGVKQSIKRLKKITMTEADELQRSIEEALAGGGGSGTGLEDLKIS